MSYSEPRDPAAVLRGLTPAQYEAVTATDPLLCVLAGAGTGKTRVLTLRVARRAGDGTADPAHVLVCTFTRKAADELRQRLWALEVGSVRAGTFHRTALALLTQQRSDRGQPAPTVLADRRPLLTAALGDRGASNGSSRSGRPGGRPGAATAQLETEISWAKARLVTPEAYEAAAREAARRSPLPASTVAAAYRAYEDAKRRKRVLDLDDLLWRCGDLLEEDREFATTVRWRFRHLFVDEMQDVNPAQFRLLHLLIGDEPDLFVVGDPNQSVYGWNGADPTLLARLPSVLPGTRVLRLDENHRSSPQVVTVATAALGLADESAPSSTRLDGPVPRVVDHPTDAAEAAWVARQLWRAHVPGRRWSQFAVLARTNAQLVPIGAALRAERIPFKLAGTDASPITDVRTALATGVGRLDDPDDGDDEPSPWSDDDGATTEAPPAVDAGSVAVGGHVGPDEDGVVLTTFHRAKGLQWPVVYVIGTSDGLVPFAAARTDRARQEERRLLYVALTRSELELTCTWARFADEAQAAGGRPERKPSPWLAGVSRACEQLTAEAAQSDRATVASRLAAIRATLP